MVRHHNLRLCAQHRTSMPKKRRKKKKNSLDLRISNLVKSAETLKSVHLLWLGLCVYCFIYRPVHFCNSHWKKMWMMMEINIFPRSLTQKKNTYSSQCVACQPIKCSNSLTNKIQWDLAIYWKIGPYVMLVYIRIFIREFRTVSFSVFLSWFDSTFLDSIFSYGNQANTTNNKIPT